MKWRDGMEKLNGEIKWRDGMRGEMERGNGEME